MFISWSLMSYAKILLIKIADNFKLKATERRRSFIVMHISSALLFVLLFYQADYYLKHLITFFITNTNIIKHVLFAPIPATIASKIIFFHFSSSSYVNHHDDFFIIETFRYCLLLPACSSLNRFFAQ